MHELRKKAILLMFRADFLAVIVIMKLFWIVSQKCMWSHDSAFILCSGKKENQANFQSKEEHGMCFWFPLKHK